MKDSDLALLCLESYLPGATIAIGDDLAANVLQKNGTTVVAFRGTANAHGWLRDLDALPKSHPLIGYCHNGFLTGACALMQKLAPEPTSKIILTGHSLGGALAVVLGALRIAGGERVDGLVTFGAPKAGYAALRLVWTALSKGSVRQYRNGNDPVPEVPLTLLAFPYCHVAELIQVGKAELEPWNCHDIRRYMEGVQLRENLL